MQVWVETGTIGFLVFLAIWIFLVRAGWRTWQQQASPFMRIGLAGSMAGAIALGLHSVIDFNLSLAGVSVALWSLLGVTGAAEAESDIERTAGSTYLLWPRVTAYVGSTLVAVGVASLLIGFSYGQQAVDALNRGDTAKSRALELQPWEIKRYEELVGAHITAAGNLPPALKKKELQVTANVWLAVVYERLGRADEVESLMAQARQGDAQADEMLDTLRELFNVMGS